MSGYLNSNASIRSLFLPRSGLFSVIFIIYITGSRSAAGAFLFFESFSKKDVDKGIGMWYYLPHAVEKRRTRNEKDVNTDLKVKMKLKKLQKNLKKVLTNRFGSDNINKRSRERLLRERKASQWRVWWWGERLLGRSDKSTL